MPKSYKMSGGKRNRLTELELPSLEYDENDEPTNRHNVCLVRKPDPAAMLAGGILDHFDELTSLVAEKIQVIEGKAKMNSEALKSFADNKDKIQKGLDMMDRLVEFVVVQPRCFRPVKRDETGAPLLTADGREIPLLNSERDPEVTYTDDVELEDRMFILQFSVGGVKDWRQFRNEHKEFVGGVEDLSGLPVSPLAAVQDI